MELENITLFFFIIRVLFKKLYILIKNHKLFYLYVLYQKKKKSIAQKYCYIYFHTKDTYVKS